MSEKCTHSASSIQHAGFSILLALALLAAPAGATIVASDDFEDGDRLSAESGLVWHLARGTGSTIVNVVDDSDGIGTGLALNMEVNTTSNRPLVAVFEPQTLADGDRIVLSLDFRVVSDPIPDSDRRVRLGLYNTMGTFVPEDTGDTSFTNDDVGYRVNIDTGAGIGSNVLSIFGNPAGTLLGGSSQGLGASTTNTDYLLNDNDPHHFVFTIEREGDELNVGLLYDDLPPITGSTAGAFEPLTFTFDQIALGLNGAHLHFRADNIQVEFISATTLLPGDANRDGRVDGEDFLIWQASFGIQQGASWDDGDFNGDGRVDGEDFLIWQAHFGSVASGSAVTPEPASLGLIGLLSGLLLARNRRRSKE